MVTLFVKNKKWLKNIFVAFLIATCIDCLVAAYQVYFMHEWRGWGFGGHPLNLASLLSIIVPIYAVIMLDDSFSKKLKQLCAIALICCIIGLVAGKSRGAWLTLGIILPLVSCYYLAKSKKALAICLVIVLAIGVVTFLTVVFTATVAAVFTACLTTGFAIVATAFIVLAAFFTVSFAFLSKLFIECPVGS